MNTELLRLYAWILRGSQRRIIINILDKPKTPTLIKEETGIKVSNVSDVLHAMEKEGLVKCLNKKDKIGRLYQLTSTGEKIKKEVTVPKKS